MVLMVGLLTLAQAQEATDTGAPEEPEAVDEELIDPFEDRPAAEMIIYGERLVDKARREVVETIEDLGYDAEVKDEGDRVVYRHPAPWYGEVVLHDDGYIQVKRQKLRVEGRPVPWAKKRNSVGAWLGCFIYPWACIRVYGATVSRRRWMGTQSRTVAELEPKVQQLGDRIADLETTRRVAALPDRLETLWADGTPLDGTEPLVSMAARRRAILEYWGSRTETVWGRMVREQIENFVMAEVQDGPHAFIQAEVDAFNRDRTTPFTIPDLRVESDR
ncbi:MAG: hypothetical protein AAF211_17175 [Myxococcota bacterium]